MQQPDRVTTSVRAYSSGEPGRVVCNARDRYFLVDEPVAFGGPGEEIDPGEAFLSGVAACAVGMLEGLSRQANLPLQRVEVWAEATVDLAAPPVHDEVTIPHEARLVFEVTGVDQVQAEGLVAAYKQR